ncbi:MAG: histidinol phosphate phosphatase domain-containing protein [Acidimicrobiia bacterium]|nr:MAG: histidinol phosphate phosphatase domain-containing protein [Acidimicrobiia bacterium]
MGDYHVHLHKHGPYEGEGPPPGQYPIGHIEAYVDTAQANGVDEIGFTEHLYRCVESKPILGKWWKTDPRKDLRDYTKAFVRAERVLSLDRYVQAVVDAKDRGLPVLLGLEVDFFPETVETVAEFLKPYPFDFLIASTHWLGAWGLDGPDQTFEFDRRGPVKSYEDYFHMESELAVSGLFDVLAHADVIKKQGLRIDHEPADLYEELAVAAARGGIAVEVSTAGLYQRAREMYPAEPLLQRFFNHRVPITLASDAHVPSDVARDRDKAVELARSVGYTERIQFRKRIGEMVPLR